MIVTVIELRNHVIYFLKCLLNVASAYLKFCCHIYNLLSVVLWILHVNVWKGKRQVVCRSLR